MRYLSLSIFVIAMYATWSLIEAPAAVPEATHVLIQEDLKRIISEKIQEDLPAASAIKFDRFWTENMKGDRVKASFVVSFDVPEEASEGAQQEQNTRHGIQGQYILTFDPSGNRWSGDGKFEYTQITFKTGVIVTPSGTDE